MKISFLMESRPILKHNIAKNRKFFPLHIIVNKFLCVLLHYELIIALYFCRWFSKLRITEKNERTIKIYAGCIFELA